MSRHPAPSIVAAAIAALTLLSAAASRADVIINEFERTAGGNGRVEIFNDSAANVDLTGWYLENQDGTTFSLSGMLGPGNHTSFNTMGLILEGGQIELYDTTIFQRDQVAFGDGGGAPLPPLTGGFSCGRSPNGIDSGDDARDWNLDGTPTFAAVNDHLPATLGFGSIRINEAGRGGLSPRGLSEPCTTPRPRIELYNEGPDDFDIGGFWLTDGRDFIVLDAFIPAGGFFVQEFTPPEFCFEQSGVLYLFGPLGRRVDQVGIRGASIPPGEDDFSFQKVPDGAPPHDGFDYPTSGGSQTWVIRPMTFGGSNGQGPVTGADDTVESSTWGRTKAGYRE